MRKLLKKTGLGGEILAIFIAFCLLASLYEGSIFDDRSKILLTVTSFVFGVYISYLLNQSRSRQNKIVEALREESGYLKALYFMYSETFPSEKTNKVRKVIDEYLTVGIDYKLQDYDQCNPEFEKLYREIMNTDAKTPQQNMSYMQAARIISEISKARSRIEAIVRESMWKFEWLIAGTLLALVIFFVFSINPGSIGATLLSGLLATALTNLLIVLQRLNNLTWKESDWIWEPLDDLFRSLDLLPYVPKLVFDTGRIEIREDKDIRLVEYPNPYPDVRSKIVKVVNTSKLD